jgi:hypothetical protein
MSLDLRPLTLGELLDRSFSLYRRHFWLFVGLMVIPSLFTLMFAILGQLLPTLVQRPAAAAEFDPLTMIPVLLAGAGAFVLFVVGYLITYMLALGATTIAVSELHVGRHATIASAYGRVRGHVGDLMLLMLFLGLRLLGLFLAFIVVVFVVGIVVALATPVLGGLLVMFGTFGGIIGIGIFSLRWALSVPALVLEQVTPSRAIRRSVALTRGNMGRTFLLVLFAMIITYAAMAIFQGPFTVGALMAGPETSTAFWLNLVGAVTGTVGGAISGPLMIIALALLYYDVRIRNEGLDVQLMMATLDGDAALPSPAG